MANIMYRCPGCQQMQMLILGWTMIEINGVLTSVDRDNPNCRLYREA